MPPAHVKPVPGFWQFPLPGYFISQSVAQRDPVWPFTVVHATLLSNLLIPPTALVSIGHVHDDDRDTSTRQPPYASWNPPSLGDKNDASMLQQPFFACWWHTVTSDFSFQPVAQHALLFLGAPPHPNAWGMTSQTWVVVSYSRQLAILPGAALALQTASLPSFQPVMQHA